MEEEEEEEEEEDEEEENLLNEVFARCARAFGGKCGENRTERSWEGDGGRVGVGGYVYSSRRDVGIVEMIRCSITLLTENVGISRPCS